MLKQRIIFGVLGVIAAIAIIWHTMFNKYIWISEVFYCYI